MNAPAQVSPAALRQRRHRARLAAAREVEFVREDWTLFLDPDRLPQKAGCPRDRLRAMVLKELVDNALDAGARINLVQVDEDTWTVTDDGPGLDRGQVVRFFAVNRALTSTKLLRRPTRGAIGNGLRVVTGGVLASGGKLQVESRGARHLLDVDRRTGETRIIEKGESAVVAGTRVTVAFGPALPRGDNDGWMACLAIHCAGDAAKPMRSHPSWYGPASFDELVQAAQPGTTVGDVAALMGVRLDDARPATEANLSDFLINAGPEPVLLPLGADRFSGTYAKQAGGQDLPVLVEVWVEAERCPPSRGNGEVRLLVNRSPMAAPVRILLSSQKQLFVYGANLRHIIESVPAGASYDVTLAITSPVIPVTTEGKESDLRPLWGTIAPALAKAMRAAHRATRSGPRKGDIKAACYEVMEEAYLKAAGSMETANARQIYYVARPLVQEILGPEIILVDRYFTQRMLPAFRADNPELTADWDVTYDARGHLVEPHTGVSIPVGTVQIREHLRPGQHQHSSLIVIDGALFPTRGPENRFATLVYVEKEGFSPLLEKMRIAERFDCAIMSTKGMSVTAARLAVDRYAQMGVRVLVAHDFDRSGACIVHTLGNDTWRYTFEADPNIVDIGLTLAEARMMSLQDEAAPDEGPGEEKLREYGLDEEEIDFLITKGRRIELNAMTSDQFVAWLEGKLMEHGAGKVVPAADVLERRARRVLARRNLAGRLKPLIEEAEAEAAAVVLPDDLAELVGDRLENDPELPWDEAIEDVLTEAVSHHRQVGHQGHQADERGEAEGLSRCPQVGRLGHDSEGAES
jgi:hypothetical protein